MDAGTLVFVVAGVASLFAYRALVLARWQNRVLSTERAALLFSIGLPVAAAIYGATRYGISPVLIAACAGFFAVQFLALRYMLRVLAEDRPRP